MDKNYHKENINIDDGNNIKVKRKYNSNYRQKLVAQVYEIHDKVFYIKIFEIVNKELKNEFTQNKNGIFFNINKLSDNSIIKIIELVNANLDNNDSLHIDYTSYSIDNNSTASEFMVHRLSNKEKNILKKKSNL
jgi:hypothetical protein